MADDNADSGSSSEEEQEDLDGLEATVTENPYSYDAHIQYVKALRRQGMLEKLREAREAMDSLFPLPTQMWQEWTQDEIRLMSGSEDVSKIESLFERGLKEYLSVPLWVEYLEFVEQHDPKVADCTPEGLAKMRTLCEKALTAAGLHLAEGWKVWEAYREFELAVLTTMENEDDSEAKRKQQEKVRSLFHRQLSVPLLNHESTLKEYRIWEEEQGKAIAEDLTGIDPNILTSYTKASKICSDYESYEGKVSSEKAVNTELLQDYLLYLRMEESLKDPARVQILYERTISVFPVTTDVWLKYTNYLDRSLKVASVCKSVYRRAVRNCPWVEELWRRYLLSLERFGVCEEEISSVFEMALQRGFQSPHDYLDIFLTRLDGLRRRMAEGDRSENDIKLLRDTFERGCQLVSTYFPDFVDGWLQLNAYWANLEAKLVGDISKARQVWENVITASGWLVEAWQGYISMEIGVGNMKEGRSLYKRCYSRRLQDNGTEIICEAWLRFERENGSLEDYERALVKTRERLEEVRAMQLQQQQLQPQKNKEEKHKTEDKKTSKRKAKEIAPKPKNKRPKATSDATSSTPAATPADTLVPLKKHKDECTAFVSNCALNVTEGELREFFGANGGVKAVRLLKNRYSGQPRGIAYVDFENNEYLLAAIELNKKKLHHRALSIVRSDPGGKKKKEKEKERKMVKPLGYGAETLTTNEQTLNSNDEFRKLLLKASS